MTRSLRDRGSHNRSFITTLRRIGRTLLLATLLGACDRQASGAITFGAAGPWTAGYGRMNRRGIELAVDDINRAEAGTGRRLQIVFRDDGGSGEAAATIAQEFIATDSIVAVVGHVNSGAMVAAARLYDGRLPAVATTATSPALSGISSWTFRVISSDSMNGVDLARFAGSLGSRRAAVMYENDSYGRGLAQAFRRAYRGQIISIDPISDTSTNFEPWVTYFRQRAPDIVFVATTEAAGIAFLREAKRQRLAANFLGGDGWTGVVVDTAASDGAYVGAPFTAEDPRPEARQFVQAFQSRFNVTPDGNAALAYDATRLLWEAVKATGPDRRRIRDWLAAIDSTKAHRGVTGAIRFDDRGDPVGKGFVMTRAVNGALVVAR